MNYYSYRVHAQSSPPQVELWRVILHQSTLNVSRLLIQSRMHASFGKSIASVRALWQYKISKWFSLSWHMDVRRWVFSLLSVENVRSEVAVVTGIPKYNCTRMWTWDRSCLPHELRTSPIVRIDVAFFIGIPAIKGCLILLNDIWEHS